MSTARTRDVVLAKNKTLLAVNQTQVPAQKVRSCVNQVMRTRCMNRPIAIIALTAVTACAVDETEPSPTYTHVPAAASTASGAASPVHTQTVWVNPIDGQTYMRMGSEDMFMHLDSNDMYMRVGSTHAMNLETGELKYMGGW